MALLLQKDGKVTKPEIIATRKMNLKRLRMRKNSGINRSLLYIKDENNKNKIIQIDINVVANKCRYPVGILRTFHSP